MNRAGFWPLIFMQIFCLKKATLLLCPGQTFRPFLKKERQINQDMNRKFLDDGNISNYETRVVTVLKNTDL
jgi:hypothetical protein